MRRSEFFKKLNSELDGIAPVLSDELKEMPIVTAEAPAEKEGRQHPFAKMTLKRAAAFAASFILFATVLLSAAGFGFAVSDGAIVTLSINPEVSLLVGKDMKVLRVISENSDGDILLSEEGFEGSVKGKNAALAAELIASKAEKLGYLKDGKTEDKKDTEDGGGKKIRIKVESGKAGPRKLPEEIQKRLRESLKNRGMDVKVECDAGVIKKFAEVFKEKKGLNTLHYKNIKDDAEKLREYLKEISFGYCRDSLIRSLSEYDLYREMEDLNEQIRNFCKESYWEVLKKAGGGNVDSYIKQRVDMIRDLIERIKAVSGKKADCFKEESAFSEFLKSADRGCRVEELRAFISGQRSPDDFFGAVRDKIGEYKQFVGDDLVSGLLSDFMDPEKIIPPEDMIRRIEAILERFYGVRIAISG